MRENVQNSNARQKKIMILGAGIYQVPLIKTARRMGLWTIVVSVPGEYPGFALADQVYTLDTREQEAILEAARAEKISGICTAGTDVAVRAIGYVCEKMGLSGLSQSAGNCVTNKAKMKSAFARGQVSMADYREVSTLEETLCGAEEIEYPVVVKRVDSSGSRGITIVENPSGIPEAFQRAQNGSGCSRILVEEFLEGCEIGVDGIVQDGRVVFLAPHEKFLYHGEQITVPSGHGFPLKASEEQLAEISRQIQLAVRAVGLDWCPFNADVMVNGNQVSIIEIGGRTGATCIPELISRYYGFDFYQTILENALGIPLELPKKEEKYPCMAHLLMSPTDGTITKIDENGLAVIRKKGVEVVLDYPAGHSVEKMCNGTTRIGHVAAQADSMEKFQEILDEVNRCIFINDHSLEELWKK